MRTSPAENRTAAPSDSIDSNSERDENPQGTAPADVLDVRRDAQAFEMELSQRVQLRLEKELKRLGNRIAEIEAERNSLRHRLEERERYLGAIHSSAAWRLVQAVRGLFGRRW